MAYKPLEGSRLTDETYWDGYWAGAQRKTGKPGGKSGWKEALTTGRFQRYFWPKVAALVPPGVSRMIEIGSAPGVHLLRWRNVLQCDVFGVDISTVGLDKQRKLLRENGIDESHSLQADFLDPGFQSQYAHTFDVVFSGGLIEHFTNPAEAVGAHLKILAPGGLLLVVIPNLRGIYRRLVPAATLQLHNLAIMRLPAFRALFPPEVKPVFCGYFGKLDFGVAYSGNTLSRILIKVQLVANLVMSLCPLPESRWTSPYLFFAGIKQ